MDKETAKIMLGVRHAIVPVEERGDEALGHLGLLLHRTCAARASLNEAPQRAQEVIEMIVEASGHHVAARATTLRIHERLGAYCREVAPELASGDTGSPKQGALEDAAGQPLRLAPATA